MSSYNYGLVNQRTKPEMEVVRNFNPTFPEGNTYAARAAVSIKSGQAMVLNANGMWILADGDDVTHRTKEIFFALHDSDASSAGGARYDALGASLGKDGSNAVAGQGEVVGYSCMGQYRLRTGYYTTTGSPAPGDFLTIDGTGDKGSLIKTTLGSGLPIVGRVAEPVMIINDNVTTPGTIVNTINSNVPLATYVITFNTWYSPNSVDTSGA
jgi:hypothetical protein